MVLEVSVTPRIMEKQNFMNLMILVHTIKLCLDEYNRYKLQKGRILLEFVQI